MDLYSILGQPLSIDESLPPETAPAAAARTLRAQPLGAGPVAAPDRLPSSGHGVPRPNFGQPGFGREDHGLEPSPPSRSAAPPRPSPQEQKQEQEQQEDARAARLRSEDKLNASLSATVERVRYITNASGVALALCEEFACSASPLEVPEPLQLALQDVPQDDLQLAPQDAPQGAPQDAMICRASSGPAAPEVGARMYIRSGLTAESIRTRQILRCDRASTDPRVNHESCQALGIESVMVLPLVLDRSVVGMLELFGSKPSAFAERDADTLRAATPQVESVLRDAVAFGMPLGRIAWAEEVPPPSLELASESTLDSTTESSNEVEDHAFAATATSVTLKVPVAFPIDAFRKPEVSPSPDPADQEVPAFLARLADEARPASNRAWSQWFRPQW